MKTKKKTPVKTTEEGKEPEMTEREKPVETKPISPDSIFIPEKIDRIYNSKDPIALANDLLQDHYRKINGNAKFDEEKLLAQAEFHVNNLVFLKQNFTFDNETNSSLMNILAKLINFSNYKENNQLLVSRESEGSGLNINPNETNNQFVEGQSNLDDGRVGTEGVGIPGSESKRQEGGTEIEGAEGGEAKGNIKEKVESPAKENENGNNGDKKVTIENNMEDIDFLNLSKDKLNEFKKSLMEENLLPKTKKDFQLANKKDKVRVDGKFFLNLKEIEKIMNYIKNDYLPYIRMWFYFETGQRRITERKIEVIINSPTLINMPLSMATEEKVEEKKTEEELEEERKKKEEEELARQEEERKKKEEEELARQEEERKKLEEKEETYLDLLERLGLNEETKKIIIEKIEELHKEIEDKIDNRKKKLEDKVKEVDESVHGKKK